MGMGIDSVAILVEWIRNPASRRFANGETFDLADLVVATAMTGDEYDRTRYLMERYLLPLMRAHRIRYVQISRTEQSAAGRYTVLSDSRDTDVMVMRGPWRLRDELFTNGVVPQVVPGTRRCSSRAKGEPMDWWSADEFAGEPFTHVIGFAAEETTRRDKDRSYTRNSRDPRYPLIEWGWDRTRCQQELLKPCDQWKCPEPWQRSCCQFCPFQSAVADGGDLLNRWRREPDAAELALRLEWSALVFNPRSRLFGRKSARTLLVKNGMRDLVDDVEQRMAGEPWAVYNVRRAHVAALLDPRQSNVPSNWDTGRKTPVSPRDVAVLMEGTAAQMKAWLRVGQARAEGEHGIVRLWKHDAKGRPYPSREHFWVAGPLVAAAKEGPGFEQAWANALLNERLNPDLRVEQMEFDMDAWADAVLADA